MPENQRILLLGYGNPGRRDDGLGPALAAALEELDLPGVTIDSDYQLTVEHAADVAAHEVVIFADAACTGPEPFSFARIDEAPDVAAGLGAGRDAAPGYCSSRTPSPVGFSTHSVSPAAVLDLARDLFDRTPAAYVLGIRGYEFNEFGEGLSPRARANLAAALDFLRPFLCRRDPAATSPAPAAAAPSQEVSA